MTKEKEEKNRPVEKEFRFSGAPYRLKDEPYDEYKARQKMLKALQKQKLKGEKIWQSHVLGTYRKEFKGHEKEITQKLQDYAKEQRDSMDSDSNSESEV